MADSPFIEDPILRAHVFREYPHDFTYHDWCLTTLEIDPKIDLYKTPQWHAALQRFAEMTCSDTVLWSRDLEQTHCVIVLVNASVDNYEDTIRVWDTLGSMLLRPPVSKHIVLNFRDYIPVPHQIEEIILIEGDSNHVTSAFLSSIDILLMRAVPGISHDPPVELVGCGRGITQPNGEGRTTLGAMFMWLGSKERMRLIDPMQQSFGGASEYEKNVARPIRKLKAEGASVTTHLLHLHTWGKSTSRKAPKRHCIIM